MANRVDQIIIYGNGIIGYREIIETFDAAGNPLDPMYRRSTVTPDQDISDLPAKVQAYCAVAWTPEVIAAWQAQTASVPGAE